MEVGDSSHLSDSPVNDTTVPNNGWTTDETPQEPVGPLSETTYNLISIYLTVACSVIVNAFTGEKVDNDSTPIGGDGGISLVGNVILCVSMLQTGAWRRPCVNLYVIAINVASLIETVFGFPLVITSSFRRRWVFGQLGCEYYAFVTYTCVLVSMTCYLLISLHRYRVIVMHVPSDNAGTRRWVACSIAAALTYALCWSVCPFLGWGRFSLEPFATSCSIDWTTKLVSGKMYNSLVFVFLLFLPVSAMTWLSVMVMKKLKTQIGTCSTHVSATTVNGTNNGEGSHNNNNATHNQGAAIQARSLKIMVLTLVMFVLFWAPYGILSMMANFDIPIDDYVSAVPTIVAKSHCAINPIVYFVCFRHYRLSVRELFGMAES